MRIQIILEVDILPLSPIGKDPGSGSVHRDVGSFLYQAMQNAMRNQDALPVRIDNLDIKKLREASYATKEEFDRAYDAHYEEGEVELDEPAIISRGDDGDWLEAWVFVPRAQEKPAT